MSVISVENYNFHVWRTRYVYRKNTLAELLEMEAAASLFDQIAPGMKESPAYGFMKDLPLEVVMQNVPEKVRPTYLLLLDAANGKEVKYEAPDPKTVKPELMGDTTIEYNIDDVDGRCICWNTVFPVVLSYSLRKPWMRRHTAK